MTLANQGVNGWMQQWQYLKFITTDCGHQSSSTQRSVEGGSCQVPPVPGVSLQLLGHGGVSGGPEQAGGVLGAWAAFIYQLVGKCLNILSMGATSCEQAAC